MHIVKRRGHKERFDERKVYGSVYSACALADMKEKDCEKAADRISSKIKKMVNKKVETDSQEIFKEVVKELKKLDKDSAFMYETHRDLS